MKNPLKTTLANLAAIAIVCGTSACAQQGYPINPPPNTYGQQSRQQPQQQHGNTCRDCGTVESIREVQQDGQSTGLGIIGGAVIGGLLGNQIGGGKGKTVGAVVGAVGGGYAGNEIEKNVRGTKSYDITVRLDDGNTRVFSQTQPPAFQNGDRIRIYNNQLNSM